MLGRVIEIQETNDGWLVGWQDTDEGVFSGSAMDAVVVARQMAVDHANATGEIFAVIEWHTITRGGIIAAKIAAES